MFGATPWPSRVTPFVDRVEQRALMVRRLASSQRSELPCRQYVHAPEGLGRWSLVSQFFHENITAFAENYLEISARQADGRPMPPGEMLGQALRAMGVSEAELPASDDARARDLQRRSMGQTYLMVIRDVLSAEQVRLLLSSSPGASVVVTTRTNLWELQAKYDFLPVSLAELPPADSRRLMLERLGETAAMIQPETLQELAALCDGHPLLIRMVAAQVVGRPEIARRMIDAARESPTRLLEIGSLGPLADQVYEALREELKRPYRLLALLPGPDFSVAAAAVVLGVDERAAFHLVDDLVNANMLRPSDRIGRFQYFRLLRADAENRVEDQDDRTAVVAKVTVWYLSEVAGKDSVLANRWRVGTVFESPVPRPSRAAALEWFEAERESLLACVPLASKNAQPEIAWQLCVGLFKYFHQQGHHDLWLDGLLVGVSAAETAGNAAAVMQLSSHRGAVYLAKGELASARSDFNRSLECALAVGHPMGEQSAHEWLGKVAAAAGDTEEAYRRYDASEAVIERAADAIPTDQRSRMLALLGLQRSRVALTLEDYSRAMEWVRGALQYFDEETTEPENRAKCLVVLGAAALEVAGRDDPVDSFTEAAALFAADKMRRPEGEARLQLGDALVAQARATEAETAYRRALELSVEIGASELEDLARGRIESLGTV